MLVLKHRFRLVEVPVRMREREHGSSSITFLRSVYYASRSRSRSSSRWAAATPFPRRGCSDDTVRISIAAAIGSVLLILVVLELIRGGG